MSERIRDTEASPAPARGGAASPRLAAYLRRVRLSRRLSQRQVARLSQGYSERLSNSYIAYCETGRIMPSLGKLLTFSRVLGVPLQNFTELLDLDRDAVQTPDLGPSATWRELRAAGISQAEAGRLPAAYASFERALELLRGDAGEKRDQADLKMDLAIVLKRMSRHFTARDLLEDSLSDLAGEEADPDRTDRALILLAGVLREMGRLPLAAMVAREAMRRAEESGQPAKEAHAASVLGNSLFDLGNVEAAAPLYEKAVRIYRQGGDSASLASNASNLANCLVRLGRFEEGVRLLREAETIARREGFERQLSDILGYLGRAFLLHGDLAKAEKHLLRSNRLARAGGYHDILFGNTWHLRRIALGRGRSGEAGDYLRSLRYLRLRVECTSAEIQEFDGLMDVPSDPDPQGAPS